MRLKNCSCLTDDNDENKKEKGRKKVWILWKKLKFEYYKSCLKATHLKKKNDLEKNKVEFIRHTKLILKPQQILRSETHNVFNEDVNKITLSANDYKRIKSIDSIETCAYGRSEGLVCRKKEIKRNNVIKQWKNN